MKTTFFSSLLLLASSLTANASPLQTPALELKELQGAPLTIGPLPYEELKVKVEEYESGAIGKRVVMAGLYLCEHANFTGLCYWGQYPISTGITPDPWWQDRITSVGPDRGFSCYFMSKACGQSNYYIEGSVHPGQNLGSALNDN
ncbi:hypothetical protein B0O99DRAFT_598217 [Bisporella sp. PMI_857]|nr:hypothetical protein B0O99DRAFT_598217 [Bisporella sp. PMI_857]